MAAVLKRRNNADISIEFHKELRRFMFRRLRHPEDVEDLMQEVALREITANAMPIEKPLAYLYGIAKHVMADCWIEREQRAQVEVIDQEEVDEATISCPSTQDDPLFEEMSAEQEVDALLRRLPDTHRAVFELHKLMGYGYEEVSAQLGLSVFTVGKYVTQAKFLLRGSVGRFCERDTRERNAAIVADREAGLTWTDLGRKHGMSSTACRWIYDRNKDHGNASRPPTTI